MGRAAPVTFASFAPLLALTLRRLAFGHMYTTMGVLGVVFAARGSSIMLSDLVAALSIAVGTTGVYLLNDVFDVEADRISHPDRPIANGSVTTRQASAFALLLIAGGPLMAFYFNSMSGIFVGMISILGVAYSVPPIRLRALPVFPNLIIALAIMLSFLAGISFAGSDISGREMFGGILLLGFFVFHSLEKDLNQEEGDEVAGILTLPLLLGTRTATTLISVLGVSSFIFPALFIVFMGLSEVWVMGIAALALIEIFVLRNLSNSMGTPIADLWYLGLFGISVSVQIILILAALF